MEAREEIQRELTEAFGEDSCGNVCDKTNVFHDGEGWKLFLCGFMAPWSLGKTADEAKSRIRELSSIGFGLN